MKAIRIRSAGHWAVAERLHGEIASRELGSEPGMAVMARPSPCTLDRRGRVWLALDRDLAVGTIRARYGAERDLGEHDSRGGLAPLIDAVGPERIVVYDRFEVLPHYRSSLAAPLLMKVAAEDTLRRGVDVAVFTCEPDAVPFFESLGFRRYRSHSDPVPGGPVPMVLVYSDRAHLTAVGSPIRTRIPDRIPAAIDPTLARLIDGATIEHRCRGHARGRRRLLTVASQISVGATAWWRG
jgi:GNAT superfamily N-acetyltransferase